MQRRAGHARHRRSSSLANAAPASAGAAIVGGAADAVDDDTYVEAPDALFVLDPDDLVDLSVEEVAHVWERRATLCGSAEAAAEALAILRVADGEDDQYLGWRAYIEHPDVLLLAATVQAGGVNTADSAAASPDVDAASLQQTKHAQEVDAAVFAGASSVLFVREPSDVASLLIDDVRAVWDRRRELCGSLEAAAEVLAVLRAAKGTDTHYRGWRAFMVHPSIQELADELDLLWPHNAAVVEPVLGVDDLLVDLRTVGVRNVRLRNGQASFRDEVMAFHGHACCITGCVERDALEAAHIIPFKGDHSNDVRNGLVLRVDIHRLFDRWLISIDPGTFEVRVAASIVDPAYRALDGRRLFRRSNAPDRAFLSVHFDQFQERAKG
ncbi:MAG: HNH endonuclease [Rhodanobacter thiooxydans]|nr:HNH endonuclease [Rhodanobacter thiooxydans]